MMNGWMDGCLVAWLLGCLLACLVGRSVGWLAGRIDDGLLSLVLLLLVCWLVG